MSNVDSIKSSTSVVNVQKKSIFDQKKLSVSPDVKPQFEVNQVIEEEPPKNKFDSYKYESFIERTKSVPYLESQMK